MSSTPTMSNKKKILMTEESFACSTLSSSSKRHNDDVVVIKPIKQQTSAQNNGSIWKGLNRRSSCKKVQKASVTIDAYTQLLCRDSSFLSTTSTKDTIGDEGTVTTTSSNTITSTSSSSHSTSPFGGEEAFTNIVPIEREQITVGQLLGQGRFSKVLQVTSINLDVVDDQDDEAEDNEDSTMACQSQLVQDASKGKLVLKRLKKPKSSTKDFVAAAANLMVEACFLTKLQYHPNIVTLRGIAKGNSATSFFSQGYHDGYFLILERLDETLESRIHTTKSWTTTGNALVYEKIHMVQQLASALAFLHEKRIIFRDVKPDNIGFANDTNDLKLFDFGLARELPTSLGFNSDVELFHMTRCAGSKLYGAPEIYDGSGMYNCKADVYSWSMVCYELLVEQKPYYHIEENNFVQYVYKDHGRPTFDEASNIPQSVIDLLNHSWDNDIFSRYTMEEVLEQLHSITQEQQRKTTLIVCGDGSQMTTDDLAQLEVAEA